jgi:hypothetical protein
MKELKESKLKTLKNVGLLTIIFGGLSLYSFNCAPPSFQIADEGNMSLSSNGFFISGSNSSAVDAAIIAPQSLLTSVQIYESMLNLTDQKGTVTNAQLQEFDRRSGSFSVEPSIEKLNAPMMIAMTSFAGEVCNGLVAREQGLMANQRKYFQSVNFGGAISMLQKWHQLGMAGLLVALK